MQNVIGTTKPIEIPAELKYKLKLNTNYTLFALPSDILDKYAVDSFEIIIDSDNKIKLVGPKVNRTSGPTSTPATEVDAIDN